MRFGQTLKEAIYPPWAKQYIDYAKLKALLRENGPEEDKPWTEDDETRFCEELLNVQLEKVAAFQEKTFKELEQRASKCDDKLRDMAPQDGQPKGDITTARFKELEVELDSILNDFRQLRKYSSINYTGFMKIVKKHDRKRGGIYRIRPMVSVSLAKRPFNTEQGYTHMMHKLSLMFFAVRQHLEGDSSSKDASITDGQINNAEETYTAYKFWVHPENLLEVKTFIARHLPILVYSQQASLDTEPQDDPKITSIYFDNAKFALYSQKANKDREGDASSLRLRWYGQLDSKSDIVLEEKIVHQNGSSEEERLAIKEKYIQSFINGTYSMEKTVQKMERQGVPQEQITEFKNRVTAIQNFIKAQDLQPVLRANYSRTAFQKPMDDRVRVSIDTELVFIREDVWDSERPCRNPISWHRLDIDQNKLEYPFSTINKGEISRFPFAVLEIKVKEDITKRGSPQWVQDLMSSHLVYAADGFSKFVHGIASLFDDQVNTLPFWLNQLESDIRQDPEQAFKEEEERKAQQAEEAVMAGSYIGGSKAKSSSYKPAVSSPLGKSYIERARRTGESADSPARSQEVQQAQQAAAERQPEADTQPGKRGYGTFSKIIPSFSRAKYNQARRRNVELPPGVEEPLTWIKNDGELKVELKVWLANERTFLKWSHICILLGTLSITLYTASGLNTVGEVTGIAFLIIALLTGLWGYYMQAVRRKMIKERSGRDFDNILGPLFVSFALMTAMILNFIFKWQEVKHRGDSIDALNIEAAASSDMSWKNEKFLWEAIGDRLVEKFWF